VTTTITPHLLPDTGEIPNSRLPLLLYQGAIQSGEKIAARTLELLFRENGWTGSWRNGVYPFHHYHSTAHEVLGVYSGAAALQLGGEPGLVVRVGAGDAILIPAGVGHKNLGSSADFGVVGAYPDGQRPDLCRGGGERPEADARIGAVPLPDCDPIFGGDGGIADHWAQAPRA
jgi:uncharacterized protein YjlB